MTANQIAYAKLKEDSRHNIAAEEETARHNVKTETISSASLRETARSNLVRERLTGEAQAETVRSNLARETETRRSNMAKESETQRHNVADEAIRKATLEETTRNNKATLAENKRSNLARESETQRHNQVTETTAVNRDAAQSEYWYDSITSAYDKLYTEVYLKNMDAKIAYDKNMTTLLSNLDFRSWNQGISSAAGLGLGYYILDDTAGATSKWGRELQMYGNRKDETYYGKNFKQAVKVSQQKQAKPVTSSGTELKGLIPPGGPRFKQLERY